MPTITQRIQHTQNLLEKRTETINQIRQTVQGIGTRVDSFTPDEDFPFESGRASMAREVERILNTIPVFTRGQVPGEGEDVSTDPLKVELTALIAESKRKQKALSQVRALMWSTPSHYTSDGSEDWEDSQHERGRIDAAREFKVALGMIR
jgi:hypothetical protein